MNADGIDEQDEPEIADETERFQRDCETEMTEENSGKKHARDAETDAANRNVTGREPEHGDPGENQDRISDWLCGREVGKPAQC